MRSERSVPLDLKILDSRLQVSRFFNKIFAKFQSKTTFSNRNGQISAKFLCAVLESRNPNHITKRENYNFTDPSKSFILWRSVQQLFGL